MEIPTGNSLLGGGRGVDHLVVAVRNLAASRNDYARALGFTMSKGGRHPGGTENSVARFEDRSYLELLGCYDRSKAAGVAAFLEKREGAMSLGLGISSANETSAFLKARGCETEIGSGTITLEGTDETPPVLWRWVGLKEGSKISDYIFFIEYTPEREAFRKKHPEHYGVSGTVHANTAVKIGSVWMAVNDVDEATRHFESIGFPAKREVSFSQMDAKGREIEAGQGTILLLSPWMPMGRTGSFLAKRGEGIVGLGLQVKNLATAQRILEEYRGEELRRYDGVYGESLLVPPELTHGVWLELSHQ